MNQKNIIIGVVVVLVLLFVWLSTYPENDSSIIEMDSESETKVEDNFSGETQVPEKQSMESEESMESPVATSPDITKRGNHTCKLSTKEGNLETEGTSFVSGVKSRVDLITKEQGAITSQVHTIYDGVWLYTWKTGDTVGTKELSEGDDSLILETSGGAIIDEGDSTVSWNCHPWIPDESKLTPPSWIAF